MKIKHNISEFVDSLTIQMATKHLVDRIVNRRKEMKLTQIELAKRSGVSYASIRRFEISGEISLHSLMKIANAINCLKDFKKLFVDESDANLKDFTYQL